MAVEKKKKNTETSDKAMQKNRSDENFLENVKHFSRRFQLIHGN
jgi:hypothetical protein